MTNLLKHGMACFAVIAAMLASAVAPAADSQFGAVGQARRINTTSVPTPQTTPTVDNGTFYETQPFVFANDQRRTARPQGNRESAVSPPALLPIFITVVVVCGLFAGLLYLVKKYLPGHRQLFSHPAMEVLGRTHLDPKRYISLVRVGKRVLVLGVTQDEIHSLSEITDDDEITSIMEVARPKTEMGLTIFQRLFQKQVLDNEVAENAAMAEAEADKLEEQMSSLRERVRAIRESESHARHLDTLG